MIREKGGIVLADEVQSGWGRLGSTYWGFEKNDAVPDIISMAKSLGNGIPVAGIATSKEIGEVLT